MPDNFKAWVISQHGKPLVVISNEQEARREFAYLSYHGLGYDLTETPFDGSAGEYAERDD